MNLIKKQREYKPKTKNLATMLKTSQPDFFN